MLLGGKVTDDKGSKEWWHCCRWICVREWHLFMMKNDDCIQVDLLALAFAGLS